MENVFQNYGKCVSAWDEISKHGPRYDHTCYIMKPRYNCAKNYTPRKEDPAAYHFALALEDKKPLGAVVVAVLESIAMRRGIVGLGRDLFIFFRFFSFLCLCFVRYSIPVRNMVSLVSGLFSLQYMGPPYRQSFFGALFLLPPPPPPTMDM